MGQECDFHNRVYRKLDERRALVIRDDSGKAPDVQTVHTFYPEDSVSLREEST